jgi:hypothetical protein
MRAARALVLLSIVTVFIVPVVNAADPTRSSVGSDRLFLAFAEDATFAQMQWWEGQLEVADGNPVDATVARLVVALQPIRSLEVGGRVGFGNTNGPAGFPDGSGATDLDVWGKWNLGTVEGDTSFAIGALATVPTGDDTVGLGFDAFNVEAFGHAGVRINGNGNIGGAPLEGKTSAILGAAILFPLGTDVSFVGEANLETERFEGADSDARILGGVNWRAFERGVFRAALAVGLTDAAPDAQLLVGYAGLF